MVVAWCKITTSASKSLTETGLIDLSKRIIPFLKLVLFKVSFLTILLIAKQTAYPAYALSTINLLWWMDFTWTGLNWPMLSGPRLRIMLGTTVPDFNVPATTRPTPVTV